MAGSTEGRSAVAPAGGCVVLVNCMATTAIAVDKEAATQATFPLVEAASDEVISKTRATTTPIRALRKWPPIRARGCARGASMAP